MLARRSRFCFTSRDDAGDETLRKVLRDSPRPIVAVPGTSCPEGPVAIAYDGSLQAARALAAFQATGLGESGQVHIISVGASAAEATRHAEPALQFLSHHKIEATPLISASSAPPAQHDPGAGSPPRRRPARDGCLRPARLARVFHRLRDPYGAAGMPGPTLLVQLERANAL